MKGKINAWIIGAALPVTPHMILCFIAQRRCAGLSRRDTGRGLGIWSSGDAYLTEAQMLGSHQSVSGPWRYERVEGASHWLQLDRPDELNRLLVGFLKAESA